ncbi:MAG: hypothetical protein IPF41_04600 [Flavobacteriales bacterium]|nr:hypothetical protein [Flavobacteriales bacterium]
MKPDNRKHQNRTVLAFLSVLVVLAVLAGAPAWLYIGAKLQAHEHAVVEALGESRMLRDRVATMRAEINLHNERIRSLSNLAPSGPGEASSSGAVEFNRFLDGAKVHATSARDLNNYLLDNPPYAIEESASSASFSRVHAMLSQLAGRMLILEASITSVDPNPDSIASMNPGGLAGSISQERGVAGKARMLLLLEMVRSTLSRLKMTSASGLSMAQVEGNFGFCCSADKVEPVVDGFRDIALYIEANQPKQ